jgi:putative DNA primase/helicase
MPTHKLIIGTNSQPAIQETKNAIWRRLKLVPFEVEIPEKDQQADLPVRLRAEFPGILAWCVRGCTEWVLHGLNTPEVIQKATAEYRAEEDMLGQFIAEECTTGPGLRIKASKLYQRYRSSLDRSGITALTMTSFGRSMAKKGYQKHISNGKWYLNIDLRSDEGDSTDGSY